MSGQSGAKETSFWSSMPESEALERYQTLVNTVEDGIYQVNPEGNFVAANDVICEMTGYERGTLLESSASLLLESEDIERIEREIRERLATGRQRNEMFECTARTATGETFVCEVQLSLLFDDDSFTGTVGVVRDITERKRTERRLRKREQQLERERDLTDRILETSPVGIMVVDENAEITRMNDRGQELLEVDDVDSFSPTDRATYVEDGTRLSTDEQPSIETIRSGEPVSDQLLRVEQQEGDHRWLSVSTSPLLTDEGCVDRVVTTGEDVTDLKERERRLERRTDELAAEVSEIYGRITDGFLALDRGWEFTYVNERAEEILGLEEDELLETDVWKTFPEKKGTTFEEHYREALSTQEPVSFEAYYPPHDSWYEEHVHPSETGLSVYLQDITERKEYERKLEASNERLEQFAYAASHDLQEPLRMVSKYLQLIERRYEDKLDDDGQAFIEFAVDGAERMKEMIDGLLEYSRVETKGDPLEPVDLDDIFEETVADLGMKVEESEAKIIVESLPRVRGDTSQLRQVFQNVLENAIEYSGEEPPRVRVSADRNGSNWTVSIRDEGIGIDPDDHERIFEVFNRLHSYEEHNGTGIGLALCKRIVERHGGEIWVKSNSAGGLTVSFTLPATASNS